MYLEHKRLKYAWGRGNFSCVVVSSWVHADVPGLPDPRPQPAQPRSIPAELPLEDIASFERARCVADARFNDARQVSTYIDFQRRRVASKPDGFKQFNPSYGKPKRTRATAKQAA